MRLSNSLGLLVLIPALGAAVTLPANAQVGLSLSVGVNVAPPAIPVYAQPVCPGPGFLWTPGYWAYGPRGYHWVVGAWVRPPAAGMLWTPAYWGWEGGRYRFHPGYWGHEVGFYGGVNYGFGYPGRGFEGGEWRGHDFYYNTAVAHVDAIHFRNVYRREHGFEDHDRGPRAFYGEDHRGPIAREEFRPEERHDNGFHNGLDREPEHHDNGNHNGWAHDDHGRGHR